MYVFDKDIHLAGATVQEQKKCIQEKNHKLWVVAFCDTLHLEYTHTGACMHNKHITIIGFMVCR